MWWTAVIHVSLLVLKSHAQLISPFVAVCPGNNISFICRQIGSISRWTIILSSGGILQNSVRSSQLGSMLIFDDDPGFHFEIHIISNSSNSITSELQVTAVRELDGVTVECAGPSGKFESAFQIASVNPPAAPRGVMTIYDQFTKTGASINVTWFTSRGADSYIIRIIPTVIISGKTSDFITTDTSLQLILEYNVNYTLNITAQNCAGKNSTFFPLMLGCGTPSIASGVVIEPFNSTQFDAVIVFHCEEGLIPDTVMEAACGATGVWSPNPAYHLCTNQSSVTCSAPIVPTNAHISNQSNGFYQEGTKVTFQCDNGSQALLTTMCYANGNWSPPPSELDCSPTDVSKVLSRSSQMIVAVVVCSFILFLIGISVGALCHRWARVPIKSCHTLQHSSESTHNPPPTNTQAAAARVTYEEVALPSDSPSGQIIELKENVAYGPIQQL